MIFVESILSVADNSGAKQVQCIRVIGGGKVACVGSIIVVAIKKSLPKSKVKKGSVYRAVVVRVRKEYVREDGSYISFRDNAAVIIDKQHEIIGTRIPGIVARELKGKGFLKIISLA
ncbi:MAG: 50S ribosomal protein L14, partial [Anaplasmataceae bacterium]|nr:50S ribosomal protein L14 [Anaplasmataceae bacterium]